MLAAFLTDIGKIEIKESQIPEPSNGEVIVQVKSALTCGTDLKMYLRGHPKFNFPMLFGHECSGVIYRAGSGVKNFKEGDEVMFVNSASCGQCYYCRRGDENLCVNLFDSIFLGAYSEFAKVPARIVQRNMFLKPKHLSFTQSAFLEPLSCVMNGIRNLNAKEGDNVLVIGDGPIGLMFVLAVKKFFNVNLILAGRHAQRLELGVKFGADHIINTNEVDLRVWAREITNGIGPNLVIECTGRADVWEESLEIVSKGGLVLLFGGLPAGTKVGFDATKIHYDQIVLRGVFHFTSKDVRMAYDFLSGNSERLNELISGKYELLELPRVFELLTLRQGIKYEIVP
ncbi:L-iditol 2-dehydrogenase [Candidatus Thermokryptus mobilis]|uniref:L-iditol 2-dehydrogenase n=1 Tax=Candidatus Thermokryptus mobilis TaxID=1643428 RepID=A0A0S4NE17_9BACT|nr:alcohol dehydrogenase catalytic domain-containing protein [Candidatus Thermokryptus mobilis]CUU09160.1 L-iditol 2-dehydrogenase [Candidatus Thermokryptus mobilis]